MSAPRERWVEFDRYVEELLVGSDLVLEAALEAGAAAGIPQHQLTPNEGKLLHLLARVQGARTILELGTLGGYSTIWLARALPAGGRLVTLELDAGHAQVARANLERAGVADRVDLRVGPALESLERLAADGVDPFDLVFIDADKRSNDEYLRWALRLSRPGTLIVADNVVREGAVADPDSPDEHAQGIRRMNELIAAEPRLTATAVQTVGAKGWDGIMVALVEPAR